MKVVSTGVNSAVIRPGPERERLAREGRWREFRQGQERPIDAPAPTLDRKVGGAWLIHEAGARDPATARHISVDEAARLQSYPHSTERITVTDYSQHVVIDLFAGTGWGVACQQLGVREYGVEIMPEAVATRAANGMETIYEEVWDAHLLEQMLDALRDHNNGIMPAWTLIGSPPCQKFSMAGGGAGRRALDRVLDAIKRGVWRDIRTLREESDALQVETKADLLVLSPLYYAYRYRPTYIALEQVPPVLPVWEAMAEALRELGYSVWTGKLNAEQYGVPQTRTRAILMARNDGVEVVPPTPTHSRYYPRDPERLDPGVQKWVSMAEALGWAEDELVGFPRLDDGRPGGAVTIGGVDYRKRDLSPTTKPAQPITEKVRSWTRFDGPELAA